MARPSASSARRGGSSKFGSRTDIGCLRDHNEDSLVVAPPLFAVADGMGGHAAGEVASEIAVRTLSEMAPSTPDTEALSKAVVAANLAVINAAQEKGRGGMGTTLTAAVLEKERLAIAQVGDSRAYLLHQGHMQQLTRDHSLMADMIEAGELTPEEARVHPQRSVITRALGSDPNMQPDLYELNVSAGDRLLLCSDGLSTMLEDDEIEHILLRTRDPQRCASVLVNEAISAGGHDNITVIVTDIAGNAEAQQRKIRRRSRAWAIFIVLALIAVVCGICYGVFSYTQNMAYLIDQDGKVAVYRGIPDTVMGISLSSFDRVTDIETDKLQPGTANHLKSGGIRVDNMSAAEDVLSDYRTEVSDSQKREATSTSSSSTSTSSSTGTASSTSTGTSGTSTNAYGTATGTSGTAGTAGTYTSTGGAA